MKDITVAEVYQFVLLIAILIMQAAYFWVNKEFENTMTGALIGLAVGIAGKNIGIDKEIKKN